jgi:multiple sugar transport system permease protein
VTEETLPVERRTAVALPRLLRRPHLSPLERREAFQGLLFISPWIIGFIVFTFLPMVAAFAFSFTNIEITGGDALRFVGLDNYQKLLVDPDVFNSLKVTFVFAAIWLPVTIAAPFFLAVLLNSPRLRGSSVFRVLIFLPYVVPVVAGILIWQSMLLADTGWVNEFLRAIGWSNPPDWLQDPTWIYPGMVIVGIWTIGSAVIVNLAGLNGVPTELYDAAKIDGAGAWAQMRHITLPMVSPVIFYSLTLGVVGVLQFFLVPYILKNGTGEPGGTTMFYNLYIYKNFFTFQHMAYGATLAWLLFLITLVITVALFASARRWVYYAGER